MISHVRLPLSPVSVRQTISHFCLFPYKILFKTTTNPLFQDNEITNYIRSLMFCFCKTKDFSRSLVCMEIDRLPLSLVSVRQTISHFRMFPFKKCFETATNPLFQDDLIIKYVGSLMCCFYKPNDFSLSLVCMEIDCLPLAPVSVRQTISHVLWFVWKRIVCLTATSHKTNAVFCYQVLLEQQIYSDSDLESTGNSKNFFNGKPFK